MICFILLSACITSSKISLDEYRNSAYVSDDRSGILPEYKEYGGHVPPSLSNDEFTFRYNFSRALSAPSSKEVDRMKHLLWMKKCTPSKSEKYDKMIQSEITKLQQNRDRRIIHRIEFLHAFYNDLYQLPQNEFTDKYKRHSVGNILKAMKKLYEQKHGKDGYLWTIFGDNKMHGSSDFTVTQPNGKSKNPKETYPYSYLDNPWFRITMGENYVDIKVDGEKEKIKITGIVNPYLNIAIVD